MAEKKQHEYRNVPPGDQLRVVPGYRVDPCPKCKAPYASTYVPDGMGDVMSSGYCTSSRCGYHH